MSRLLRAFKLVTKHCKECGVKLQLNTARDVKRKNFCSRSCTGKSIGKKVNMLKLWEKAHTSEANAKKGHKKENHPKWISNRLAVKGRPMPEKNEWRNLVFKRDNFSCMECKVVGGRLEAHHKAPYSLFPKLQNDLANGITLCKICHKKLHAAATELFGAINSQKHRRGENFASC